VAQPDDTAAASASEPGARLGTVVDKYTLVRLLGRGGMGAVYEARHATLSRRFALKFLLPELAANRELLRRFTNEAKAAGGLEHPNLAAVTDFGRAADGAPYIVMEFLPGEDCARLLKRTGILPIPRAANVVAQACRGLAVAHDAGIVHRDLKPENLFLTDAGDGSDLVKVLDFGIAKLRVSDASVVTGTGATFGTAFYMSPEQARGAGEVDARTDVWSLGVVLYELLTGRKPFQGEQFLQVVHQILSAEPPPLASLRPGLPAKLVAAVEKAMAKDVAARVPSVRALGEMLAPFTGGRVATAREESLLPTAPTAATPATGLVPGAPAELAFSEPAVRSVPRLTVDPVAPTGAPEPSPARVSGATTRPRGRAAAVAVGAVVLLAAGAATLFAVMRRPQTAPPAPSPAVTVVAPPVVAAPAPAPLPPTPPAPKVESELSGQSGRAEPATDKRNPPRRPTRRATAAVRADAPNPAPPAQIGSARHPVEIDKDDPYAQ
jgi:serine/threonine-protein kinase